jgi:hypothetical protein
MDMKDEGWASLSIDLRNGITYLIHPNLSAADTQAVLDHHIDLMKTLTQAVKLHMVKLANFVLPMKDWEYEVALKTEHVMNGLVYRNACYFLHPMHYVRSQKNAYQLNTY